MALEKMTENYNSNVERSAVGEVNVVNKMEELDSKMGGEGNGGVILREAHLGRDAMVGATLVLNRMSQSENSISELFNALPQFQIVKDKVELQNVDEKQAMELAKSIYKNASIDRTDGIKFSWSSQWIHLRKSNTEPILRIYAEAPTLDGANQLVNQIKTEINGHE
jgi:phosphomannomutase